MLCHNMQLLSKGIRLQQIVISTQSREHYKDGIFTEKIQKSRPYKKGFIY